MNPTDEYLINGIIFREALLIEAKTYITSDDYVPQLVRWFVFISLTTKYGNHILNPNSFQFSDVEIYWPAVWDDLKIATPRMPGFCLTYYLGLVIPWELIIWFSLLVLKNNLTAFIFIAKIHDSRCIMLRFCNSLKTNFYPYHFVGFVNVKLLEMGVEHASVEETLSFTKQAVHLASVVLDDARLFVNTYKPPRSFWFQRCCKTNLCATINFPKH